MTKTDNIKKGFEPKAVTSESLKKQIEETCSNNEETIIRIIRELADNG